MSAPRNKLKLIQKRINTLLTEVEISNAAHCGVKGRSHYSHAAIHSGSKCLFQLDVEDFYPNISHYRVFHLFRHELKCSEEVAGILTRLCTVNGQIPQGAPTSTTLANLVCRKLDARFTGLSKKHSIQYSRYNDDLTFSGDKIPNSFKEKVREIVTQSGFPLNTEKESTAMKSEPQVVTGLSVNRRFPRVPRKTRREWRQQKHIFERFTAKRLSINEEEKQRRSFLGKAAYLAYINKKRHRKDSFEGSG